MSKEVKKVLTPKSMILFQSARKISSHLIREKLYPTERTGGSYKLVENAVKSASMLMRHQLLPVL